MFADDRNRSNAKVEIAYLVFGRRGELVWRRVTVRESKVEQKVEELINKGAIEFRYSHNA